MAIYFGAQKVAVSGIGKVYVGNQKVYEHQTGPVAGLYDANDNLIATYAESGLIADADYTSSTHSIYPGSGYCTLQRYPTCKKIILPNTITQIGSYAFYNCSGLTSIIIENIEMSRIKTIGEFTFGRCSGLTSINIPNSVQLIRKSAFRYCSGLTSIIIPDSVVTILESAFESCTNLTSATIGNGIDRFGIANGKVFYRCSNLTLVIFNGTPSDMRSSEFDYCSALTDIYVPWSEGAVAGAPWGATNATIHYNYTPS